MLRADVVEAAEKGLFHVWPVETVDEAVELLTGVPAGERGAGRPLPRGLGQPARGRPAGRVRGEGPQLRARPSQATNGAKAAEAPKPPEAPPGPPPPAPPAPPPDPEPKG